MNHDLGHLDNEGCSFVRFIRLHCCALGIKRNLRFVSSTFTHLNAPENLWTLFYKVLFFSVQDMDFAENQPVIMESSTVASNVTVYAPKPFGTRLVNINKHTKPKSKKNLKVSGIYNL